MSHRELRLVLVVSLLFVAGAMIYVWINVSLVKQAYEFQILKRENQRLLRANRILQLEKDSLSSLSRVQALAQSEIGLRQPESSQ
ncbi:MAG: cell division protein FtsL, partial [Nitrospinales bacterium]